MKKLFMNLFLAWLTVQTAGAKDLEWLTNASEAQKKAKDEKKIVLLDFTGSDWCGWCMKLKKEVFDTKEFVEFATKNLVLVEVDFPMQKKLPEEQKKANEDLQKKYGVEGYPTIILLDGDGKKIGQMDYMPGGPKPFITRLKKIKSKAAPGI
jgi:thioredoxin-related protein